jgi:hypothetical protein
LFLLLDPRDNKHVPAGRPSSYTPELAELICERLADGESVRSICESAEMPDRTTVRRWLGLNADFAAKCARAWELQADWYTDKQLELSAAAIAGRVDPQAARVAMSAYQWVASKRHPKRYGDTQNINQRLVDEQGRDREPLNVVFVGVGQSAVAARGKPPALALQPPESDGEKI